MEDSIPSPNFDQERPDGFLGFSSTPIQGKNFKPKWGKKNRQDNWNRFGQSQQDTSSDQMDSPRSDSSGGGNHSGYPSPQGNTRYPSPQHHGGSGDRGRGFSPRGSWNSSPRYNQPGNWNQPPGGGNWNQSPRMNQPPGGGNWNQSPRMNQPPGGGNWNQSPRMSQPPGGGNWNQSPRMNAPWNQSPRLSSQSSNGSWNSSPQNHSHNHSQNHSHGTKGYFHPSMIEDPWAILERKMPAKKVMSDSMIPQVGDSLLLRNQELNETQETTLADSTVDETQ